MKKFFFLLVLVVLCWWFFFYQPKAQWQGQVAVNEPDQSSENFPAPWDYKDFTITPKAKYHIKAIVLSKHSYWAGEREDSLAFYDLALGWGPMSDSSVINQLRISQSGRWYEYRWDKAPPINPSEIISHSANNHIVPADDHVFQTIKRIKKYDLVEIEGYLVYIQSRRENWHWHSSLSRTDTAGGSCELIWVTNCLITKIQ